MNIEKALDGGYFVTDHAIHRGEALRVVFAGSLVDCLSYIGRTFEPIDSPVATMEGLSKEAVAETVERMAKGVIRKKQKWEWMNGGDL